MSGLLVALVVIYAIGVLVVATWGLLDWGMARSLQRDYVRDWQRHSGWLRDFDDRQVVECDREAREGARRFVQSPLWPLLALGVLVRIVNDSKGEA
jgi:hypothetical protein